MKSFCALKSISMYFILFDLKDNPAGLEKLILLSLLYT